jgi:hypothetical protein
VLGNGHAGFGGRLPGKGPTCRNLAGQPTLLGAGADFVPPLSRITGQSGREIRAIGLARFLLVMCVAVRVGAGRR